MTPLDLPLTPAQWEHYDQHGWTLTEAPMTECRNTLHDLRNAPVSEYHCPECGRAPYRSKDGDWYCFDPKGESACRWRGPTPKVTPCCVPVPATVPCPECGGTGQARIGDLMTYLPPCRRCSGSGVVPRVVGIIPPEWCGDSGPFPAERVGIATVTAVPVVDADGSPYDPPLTGLYLSVEERGGCWLYGRTCPNATGNKDEVYPCPNKCRRGILPPAHVTALLVPSPSPGDVVWRLDKENDHE